MDIYLVGGAVRDALLGKPVTDRDWVVVGATPESMRARGFRPVGRDFPVFLHPDTGEEYALARTERKTGPGHQGFAFHADPDVTLEQDLARRDLTINAMAQDAAGNLVDPFGGRADLDAGVLRHVSAAFTEDPLRLFRVCRFAAQLPGFTVAPETLTLMRTLAGSGELAALSGERVFQEFRKALAAPLPDRFLAELAAAEAFQPWFPELAGRSLPFPEPPDEGRLRFGGLGLHLQAAELRRLCERLRVPNAWQKLALALADGGSRLLYWQAQPVSVLHGLLARLGAYRHPDWAEDLAPILAANGGVPLMPLVRITRRIREDVVSGPLRAAGLAGPALGRALDAARQDALTAVLAELRNDQPDGAVR